MENLEQPISDGDQDVLKTPHRYVAWALLPDPVSRRVKKVMDGLRAEFGGPEIEPHIPVLGSITMVHEDAVNTFREACGSIDSMNCRVTRVGTTPFYFQCVHLFIDPNTELRDRIGGFSSHFGRITDTLPHLALLYGDLSEEEKKTAQEKVGVLDEGITSLSFTVNRLALYKCNDEDRTQQSWEKILEVRLS